MRLETARQGGGRGDLALAIGACLGARLADLGDGGGGGGGAAAAVRVHVLVLDINPRSLEQGERRARCVSPHP
eukprot:SAG25_NODE_795_length_5281_cov_2.756465_2_plen_73_part_00